MTIKETIELVNLVSPAALKAAGDVKALAKAIVDYQRASKVADKVADQAFKASAKVASQAAKAEERALKEADKAAKASAREAIKAAERAARAKERETTQAEKAAARAAEKAARVAAAAKERALKAEQRAKTAAAREADRQRRSEEMAQAIANKSSTFGSMIKLDLLKKMAESAVKVTRAIFDLGVSFAKALVNASELHDEALGTFELFNKGSGGEALAHIDKLSAKLGVSLGDARKQYTDFRKAGLNNAQSQQLITLAADIKAVTGSSEKAEEAISKTLDAHRGKRDINAQMKALADSANTSGKGFDAATKASTTLGGALNKIKDLPARFFDSLAADPKVVETLNSLGKTINKVLSDLGKSGKVGDVFSSVTKGVSSIVSGIEKAAPLVGPFIDGLTEGFRTFGTILSPIGKALSAAFGGETSTSMQTMATVAKMLGTALASVAVALAAVGVAVIAVGAWLVAPIVIIGQLVVALARLVKAGLDAGKNLVAGLTKGITDAATGAVAAAKALADKVSATIKSALMIKSPSRVTEYDGKMIDKGLERGIYREIPAVETASRALAESALPQSETPAQPRAFSGAPAASSGPITINVTVTPPPGASSEEAQAWGLAFAAQIRAELSGSAELQALQRGSR